MKCGRRKGQKGEIPLDDNSPTAEQLRVKGIADAISVLMQVPSENDSAVYALPLVKKLNDCIERMLGYSDGKEEGSGLR